MSWGTPEAWTVAITKEHHAKLQEMVKQRKAEPCEKCGHAEPVTMKSITTELLEAALNQLEGTHKCESDQRPNNPTKSPASPAPGSDET